MESIRHIEIYANEFFFGNIEHRIVKICVLFTFSRKLTEQCLVPKLICVDLDVPDRMQKNRKIQKCVVLLKIVHPGFTIRFGAMSRNLNSGELWDAKTFMFSSSFSPD